MSKSVSSTDSKTEIDSGYGDKKDIVITPDAPKVEDDNSDDYGYDESPSEEEIAAKKIEEDKKIVDDAKIEADKKAADEDVKNPSTGYDLDEDSPEDEKPEDKPEEKDKDDDGEKLEDEVKIAEKLKADIAETVKGLPEGYSQEKASEFAKVNGLTNEQMKAYVDMENAANVDFKQSQVEAKAAQKKAFITELKTDSTFGGENFEQSLKNSEKVLEKHFPNFKKTLTDKGGMVPPYLMKDLLALHKTLNPTTTLVTGNPITPKVEKGDFLDELYE